MIKRSARFQEQFLEELQIDISAFANSEARGFVEDPALKENEKYRQNCFIRCQPTSVDEIMGHRQIVNMLAEWTCTGRYPLSLILSGARGIGKTTLLEIFATKGTCVDFKPECFFASCRKCLYHPWTKIIDCARLEISTIKKHLDLNTSYLFSRRSNIIFLDELNYNKASEISIFITRRIETAHDAHLFISCNEGIKDIDPGLKTRSTHIELLPPSLSEMTAWLYKYASFEKIHISLLDAFIICKSIRPEGIPREALKKLELLYGIKPEAHKIKLRMILNLNDDDIYELTDNFDCYKESIEQELENWE